MTGDMQQAVAVTAMTLGVVVIVMTFAQWLAYIFRKIF